MKIYRLGPVDGLRSMTVFHAMARLGYEGLIITSPKEVYVSVGFFDRTEEIIDLKRCRELNIPVMRREVGGGAVLLDRFQVFYQLILRRGSKYLPFKVEDAYKKFSKPVINTYKRLGIETLYKPINDIVVARNGRKISGQGGADIGKSFVFVGNILLRFNTRLMAELFRVQDESFREKLLRGLEENISWVERETRKLPLYEEVESVLVDEFSRCIDFEGEDRVPEEVIQLADRLKTELTSEEVLLEDTGRKHRAIKIKEGLFVRNAVLRTEKVLIKAEVLIRDGKIESVKLYGDIPPGFGASIRKLEDLLRGTPFQEGRIREKLGELFSEGIDLAGISEEALMEVIYGS